MAVRTSPATMASKDLLSCSVFKDTWNECQDIQERLFENLREEFQWLDEIFHTACSAFTVKSKKLEQMPKTPSAKNRMQNRKRKQDMIKVNEELTPKTSKQKVTRLKFDDPVEDQDDSECMNTSRPLRKCRTSKNVPKVKTAPKQRKGKKMEEFCCSMEALCPGLSLLKHEQIGQNNQVPEASGQSEVNKRLSEIHVSSTNGNILQTDDSSPSVKTRVRDYENLILTPHNQSGSKTMSSKTLAKVNGGSNSKSSPRIGLGGSRLSPCLTNADSGRQKSTKVDKKPPQGSPAPKQTRTRLRLKKQQEKETSLETMTCTETNVQEQFDTQSAYPNTESEEGSSTTLEYQRSLKAVSTQESVSETQVNISDMYELSENGTELRLQKYEVVKNKATLGSKESKMDGQHQVQNSLDLISEGALDTDRDSPMEDKCPEEAGETSRCMSTRTRTRLKSTIEVAKKDSGVIISDKANSTFTTESESGSDDGIGRSTRTRARLQKEKEAADLAGSTLEDPVRKTRTRHRAQEKELAAGGAEQATQKSAAAMENLSRPHFLVDSRDDKISGSPATPKCQASARGSKRIIEHGRGLSPAPKRARSNIGQELLVRAQPLSTSSPIKNLDESELRDTVPSAHRAPQPFRIKNGSRQGSGFFNRTPGSSQNWSLFQHKTTFLRATPSPQRGPQNIFTMEQRKKHLAEKENKEKERIRRFEEKKKQDLEKRKRDREERFQKVAALRQEQEEKKKQQEEQYKRKLGTTAANKAKLQEDREREEAEKRKQRQRKQMEADFRRKQEEEERHKKILEQEEEARQQEALFLKKRKHEELLRKQRLAEEKAKSEERLAEKEQKFLEEKTKILQLQRERELIAEKARIERENQLLQERLERERLEKEKKAEKEKKLREEMERLKQMEQERLYLREQELQKQKEMAAKERELKQIISNHNKSILNQKQQQHTPASGQAPPNILNTTQTLNTSKTVITAVANNSTSYEITPAKIYTSNSKSDYGLDDKESDDSTDDEDAPKKKIPDWAMGINLNTALIKQCTNPPDLDKMFRFSAITPPDLEKIFKGNCKKRYKQRTSSAIWNTPPLKHC